MTVTTTFAAFLKPGDTINTTTTGMREVLRVRHYLDHPQGVLALVEVEVQDPSVPGSGKGTKLTFKPQEGVGTRLETDEQKQAHTVFVESYRFQSGATLAQAEEAWLKTRAP